MDMLTNRIKLPQYIQIAQPQYIYALRLQIFCSPMVIDDFFRGAMLRTIQFYYKLRLTAVKISNIVPNYKLSVEFRCI